MNDSVFLKFTLLNIFLLFFGIAITKAQKVIFPRDFSPAEGLDYSTRKTLSLRSLSEWILGIAICACAFFLGRRYGSGPWNYPFLKRINGKW